jgi:sugar lactone lactonase YvrE
VQDGVGANALFGELGGIVEDAVGNLYVSDAAANTIRKVTQDGYVTTVAGTTSVAGSVDGTGTAAQFKLPTSLAMDAQGNIYVADSGNQTVRKLTPAGVVTTIAGTIGARSTQLGPLPGAFGAVGSLAFLDANDLLVTSYSGVLKLTLPH